MVLPAVGGPLGSVGLESPPLNLSHATAANNSAQTSEILAIRNVI
jgi:hypothetical protein